jgi:predicted O-methyltransferase YrrM
MSVPTRLCELAIKYRTDKTPFLSNLPSDPGWTTHSYTPFYHEMLDGKDVKRVLEIGVAKGNSLRMWADYFPQAEIFGVDNNPDYLYSDDGRIKSFLGDQSTQEKLLAVMNEIGGTFDLIIEDGSHNSPDQVVSANTLVPLLAPGGIYVAEDVCHPEDVLQHLKFKYSVKEFLPLRLSDDRLVIIRQEDNA